MDFFTRAISTGLTAGTLGLMALLFILAQRDRAKYESGHPELKALEEADV